MKDVSSLSDADLLSLLRTEEDRLPRAAVDEAVRRADRMIGPLTAILRDANSWRQEGSLFWTPIHAAFILGAIGGERALEGLRAAAREAVAQEVDWIVEPLPAMFGRIGPAAVPVLEQALFEEETLGFERELYLDALAAVAAHHPETREATLALVRRTAEDEDEEDGVRGAAAVVLLHFALPEDRKFLERWARREEQKEFTLFDRESVREAYSQGRPELGHYFGDWLEFYRPDEIEARRQRWTQEDEDTRWAAASSMKEPWVDREVEAFLQRYGETLSGGETREAALEIARQMMLYAMEREASAPWRWSAFSAESCLMDHFVVERALRPEAELRPIPGLMMRFLRFWVAQGRLEEETVRAVEARLESVRDRFVHDALHPEEWEEADAEGPPEGGPETFPGPDRPIEPPPAMIANRGPAPAGRGTPGSVGRNAACPCGSGKKFKRCCGG